MIAHEFGHVWGLNDAYEKSYLAYWYGAKVTKEVSKNSMMRANKEVQSNDIEMLLRAYMENAWQYYFDYLDHPKSVVVRLD